MRVLLPCDNADFILYSMNRKTSSFVSPQVTTKFAKILDSCWWWLLSSVIVFLTLPNGLLKLMHSSKHQYRVVCSWLSVTLTSKKANNHFRLFHFGALGFIHLYGIHKNYPSFCDPTSTPSSAKQAIVLLFENNRIRRHATNFNILLSTRSPYFHIINIWPLIWCSN